MSSILLCAFLSCCLLWGASAAAPNMASFAAYITVNENTLYIQGGSNVSTSVIAFNQFFALDLTQSWNTSSPLWSEVTTIGIPARLRTFFHSISLSRNSKTLTFWDVYYSPPYAVNYQLETKKWEKLPALPLQRPLVNKVSKAATDPTTDQVYIPGGAGSSMLTFDPFSSISTTLPMPSGGRATSWNACTFSWNDVRKTFLLFGGFDTPGSSYFYEYKPSSDTPWTALVIEKGMYATLLFVMFCCPKLIYKIFLCPRHSISFMITLSRARLELNHQLLQAAVWCLVK